MKQTIIGLKALMVLILFLTACVPAATPAPTIDVNQLFTQAAQTVIAQLTKNAPTATLTPAVTKAPTATNTPIGGALPTLPPLNTLPALSTPTKLSLNIPDKAAYITQSPSDNSNVTSGKVFNITWHLKNTGTTTWNQNYQYRYYASINKIPTAANGYSLTKTVPPNGEIDLTVVATAPSGTGPYDTQWVLTNPEGTNFSLFTLAINVVAGSGGGGNSPTQAAAADPCSDTNVAFGGATRNVTVADPLTIDMQGGQVYIAWGSDTTAAVTFTVQYGGVNVNGLEGKPFTSSGSKWFGSPDQESHVVKVTVTGGTLPITSLYSINSNHQCY
jgi:hypothetical protein